MRTYLVSFLMSLGISAMSTPAVLHLARRWQLFDPPDGVRKIHIDPTPRMGGIAIAAGFLGPIIALLFVRNLFADELRHDITRMAAFLLGMLTILGLGIYDDLRGCGAWSKLAVQTAVAVMLWQAGLRIETVSFSGVSYDLGLASLPLTIVWVAGIINAMNLIDGLDGLAAGVGFFAAVALFSNALNDAVPLLALFATAIGGSLLGFLFYNFSPALIFMGDSGSMSIGYVFATAALWSASKRSTALALLLPVLSLGLPVADTIIAFTRRSLHGQSPFQSDRKHIHHRLLDLGLSQRQAVLVLYLVCGLLTGVAVLLRKYAF